MESKFIYAMYSCGFVKIGVSIDPEARAKSINTPEEIVIWSTSEKYENAFEIERRCHSSLSSSRVKGEWFNCSHDDAINEIKKICAIAGVLEEESKGKKDHDVSSAISLINNQDLIPGTLLLRNEVHRMIYAELISTYEIDWITEQELRLLITDDNLFDEIKGRLKGNCNGNPAPVSFV